MSVKTFKTRIVHFVFFARIFVSSHVRIVKLQSLACLQTLIWFFCCYLPARLFRNFTSKKRKKGRQSTNWQMTWQLWLSSVLYTLVEHALSTNDSACYFRTSLLIFTWHHQIRKSKNTGQRKFLSSSGIWGSKFASVFKFLTQKRAWFGNQSSLKFRVMVVAWHKAPIAFMDLSSDFQPFFILIVRKSVFVRFWFSLDNQWAR